MASEPKLVVALEARLNKFEKQLKEAGVIADKSVKEIEDKFAKANPAFKGTFAGSFLGGVSAGLMDEFTNFIKSIPKFFKDISDTAKIAAIDVESVFAIGQSVNNIEAANTSLQKMATLLDRAKRGENNTLAQLFSRNNIDVNKIKDVEEAWMRVSDLVQRAPTKVMAIEITEAAGAAKELAGELAKGPEHLRKMQEEAKKVAPDIKRLADNAENFNKAMSNFATWAKADAFTGFRDGLQTTAREIGWVIQGLLTMATLMGKLPSVAAFAGQASDEAAKNTQTVANQIAPLLAKLQQLKQVVGGEEGTMGDFGSLEDNSAKPKTKITLFGGGPSKSLDIATKAEKERLDQVQRFIVAQQKANDVLQAEIDTLFKSNAEKQIAIKLAEAEAAAALRKKPLDEKEIEIIRAKATANAELNKTLEARKPIADFIRDGQAIEKNFANVAVSGLRSFEDALISVANKSATTAEAFKKMAASIIADIGRILIRAAVSNALSAIFAPGAGAAVGTVASGAGFVSANPPKFAEGGFLGAGKWGIAGEQGPELIKGPAQIIPSDITSGMGAGQNFTYAPMIDARGADVAAVAKLAQLVAKQQAEFESRVKMVVRERSGKRW